jgi:hypothetical protein
MSSNASRIVDLLMNQSVAKHAAMPARHRKPAVTALVEAVVVVMVVAAVVAAAAVAVAATAVAVVAAAVAAVVVALAVPARCSRRPALPAARLLKFPLSRRATGRFIAGTVSRPSALPAATELPNPSGRRARKIRLKNRFL